jgi:adenylate kinase
MQKQNAFIIMGPQGSGKGTLSVGLCEKYNLLHISVGDVLRDTVKAGKTDLAKKIKTIIDAGELVSNDIVIELLDEHITANIKGKHGVLLDGYPRNEDQFECIDKLFISECLILVEVPEELIFERLGGRLTCEKCKNVYNQTSAKGLECCNRMDLKTKKQCGGNLFKRVDDGDNEVIKKRLDVYHRETEPLIEKFKQMVGDKVVEISNESPDIEKTQKELYNKIDAVLQ